MSIRSQGRAIARVMAFAAAAAVLGVPTWINHHHQRGRHRARAHTPEHWSIVVIDITNFGRWTNQSQLRARAALNEAVRAAFREAGIGWSRLAVEDRGDGMIVLVPAGVSKANLLDPMIPSLAAAIHRHNSVIGTADRVRLRVSVHAGEIHRDRCGWAGADLNLACRLVNGEPVYRQLQHSPQADLILVVSDLIRHNVVRHGYRRIDPASYTPAQIVAKEVNTRAWLHVPDPTTADLADKRPPSHSADEAHCAPRLGGWSGAHESMRRVLSSLPYRW